MLKLICMLTFLTIAVITHFSKFKGMGKLAVLYAIVPFVIIAAIAYVVACILHNVMMPLVVTS